MKALFKKTVISAVTAAAIYLVLIAMVRKLQPFRSHAAGVFNPDRLLDLSILF